MRPYAVILRDSFREALSSRVLWILLLVTTVVLALVAPFGVGQRPGTRFEPRQIIDGPQWLDELSQQAEAPRASPAGRLWTLFDEEFRDELARLHAQGDTATAAARTLRNLCGQLNDLLARRDLYDAESWSGTDLRADTQSTIDEGLELLDDAALRRVNRSLIEAAWPQHVSPNRESEVVVSYLGSEFPGSLPMQKNALLEMATATFMSFFVGVIGVFAAILVTAGMIPHTFEPGAIDLLLSKPVSRPLVFLTKFAGGCIFTLINALYLVGGLWLILGLRHGQWSAPLLWCVPLYMFLFAIYYSVSALAGVLWKNAVVSVVVTILFWGVCFVTGALKSTVEFFFLLPQRLTVVTEAGETLVAANESQDVLLWDRDATRWQQVLIRAADDDEPPAFIPRPPVIGPLYDASRDRLYALAPGLDPFGLPASNAKLAWGDAEGGFKRVEGPELPGETRVIYLTAGGELDAATSRGILRLAEPSDAEGSAEFVALEPSLRLGTNLSAAWNARRQTAVLYDGQELMTLVLDAGGGYRQGPSQVFGEAEPGLVAAGGGILALAVESGTVLLFDADDLSLVSAHTPLGDNAPRAVVVSPQGEYVAVLFHHQRLWVYDTLARKDTDLRIGGQGNVAAAAFTSTGRLAVVDRLARVTEYDLAAGEVSRVYSPPEGALEAIHRALLKPVYTIFPKPRDLANLVNYVLSSEETIQAGSPTADLRMPRIKLQVWPAVWSNLAFVAVMLALGAWYTQRKDF